MCEGASHTLASFRDDRIGEIALKPVARTYRNPATDLIHVRVATVTITTTPNHPFRVAGRGWVAAGELAAGDTLYLADGGRADIVSVTREKLATPVDVYNVEVADFHTYFVAGAGVWVHNCGGEGASSAEITFGHGARHLVGTGVSQVQAEGAIGSAVNRGIAGAPATGEFWGRVPVGSTMLEYRAYTLPSGVIHVGTYYPF